MSEKLESLLEALRLCAGFMFEAWEVVSAIRNGGLPENYDDYHERVENALLVAAGILGFSISTLEGRLTETELQRYINSDGFISFAHAVGSLGFQQIAPLLDVLDEEVGSDGQQGGSPEVAEKADSD
jgi:hypothetical protein